MPIAVKDITSPVATAIGPNRFWLYDAEKTIGSKGSTQGDRIDNPPAINANANVLTISIRSFIKEAANAYLSCVAGRAPFFGFTLKGDQCALLIDFEAFKHVFLCIEVNF